KAGIDCRVGVKVKGAKKARDGVSVDTEQGEVWARQLLVAVGRAPRSKEIGLEQVGVTTHPNGFIKVDKWMRTTAEGVHAIGFVKLVADAKSGSLIGAHVVGPSATELIAEPALTQLFQGDAWELGRNIHPHPTLSEAVMEAALAVDGHAIHI